MRIQPIVEGHGEVSAVPVLLRRLLEAACTYEVGVNEPIRQPRSRLVREESLRRAVRLALLQPDCAGLLILFDADDDCPKILAPTIQGWAQAEARDVPCIVIMPVREYEAWFLASLESLRGMRGLGSEVVSPASPEEMRDAKGFLERHLPPGRSYMETADQAALTARFDLGEAYTRSRSFRHLVISFGDLLRRMGAPLDSWPPSWVGP